MLKDFLTGMCSHIKCAEYANALTPVERVGELLFKREDAGFAPLGEGSVNGSKARQAWWLVKRLHDKGVKGLVTGCSVLSPQNCIVAAMAKHFRMSSLHVLGATNAESSVKHPSVAIAKLLGAEFDFIGSAYNNSLQPRVDKWLRSQRGFLENWDKIEYGITIEHNNPNVTPETIASFHKVGAQQVENLPEEMETLIIPAGSCNTFVSIMYGLASFNTNGRRLHPNLKKIIAVGIGPSRLGWAQERLSIISNVVGYEAGDFLYHNDVEFEYIDLHKMGVYKYSDRVLCEYEGIKFHMTYESKVFSWLAENRHYDLFKPTTVMWVVGGEPSLEATKRAIGAV